MTRRVATHSCVRPHRTIFAAASLASLIGAGYVCLYSVLPIDDTSRFTASVAAGTFEWDPAHLFMQPATVVWHRYLGIPFGASALASQHHINTVAVAIALGVFYVLLRELGVSWRKATALVLLSAGSFNILNLATSGHMKLVVMPALALALREGTLWARSPQSPWPMVRAAIYMGIGSALLVNTVVVIPFFCLAVLFVRLRLRMSVGRALVEAAGAAAVSITVAGVFFLAGYACSTSHLSATGFAQFLVSSPAAGRGGRFFSMAEMLARTGFGTVENFAFLPNTGPVARAWLTGDLPTLLPYAGVVGHEALLAACVAAVLAWVYLKAASRMWSRHPELAIAAAFLFGAVAFACVWNLNESEFYFEATLPTVLIAALITDGASANLLLCSVAAVLVSTNVLSYSVPKRLYPFDRYAAELQRSIAGDDLVLLFDAYPGRQYMGFFAPYLRGHVDRVDLLYLQRPEPPLLFERLSGDIDRTFRRGGRVLVFGVLDERDWNAPWPLLCARGLKKPMLLSFFHDNYDIRPLGQVAQIPAWELRRHGAAAAPSSSKSPVASYRLGPGWATFGLALPAGAARDALRVGTLPTQTDVKTTWNDGSIRFAIVTTKVPATANYEVLPTPADSRATYRPTRWPGDTHVDFTLPDGVVYRASLPTTPVESDVWLDGPYVHESRTWITPRTVGGAPHKYLRVIFDVRSYADGSSRVDITAENCLDVAGATTQRYDLSITVDGAIVYARRSTPGPAPLLSVDGSRTMSRSVRHGLQKNDVIRLTSGPQSGEDREVGYITGPDTFTLYTPGWSAAQGMPVAWERPGVMHRYLTRWRKVFTVGLAESSITPDLEPFQAAGAFFRMDRDDVRQVTTKADLTDRRFDITGVGDFRVYMSDHGGRPELAPYSDWIALYLMFRDPAQWEYVKRTHGDLAASWPVHVREVDGTLPSISADALYWFDERGRPGHRPAGNVAGLSDYGTGGAGVGWQIADIAHQPSLAYVPYLLTGDRFYLDEMVFWGNYTLLDTWPGDGVRGYTRGVHGEGFLRYALPGRGVAWALRNLADVAAYTPDDHIWKTRFADVIANNLADLDAWADAQARKGGVAPFFEYTYGIKNPKTGNEFVQISPWQHDFLAVALQHVWDQKLSTMRGRRFFDRLVADRMAMGLDNAPSWPFEAMAAAPPTQRAAPFYAYVGEVVNGTWTDYRTWADVYAANTSMIGTPHTPFTPLLGWYASDTYAFLVVACAHGVSKAQAALDWLLPQMRERRSGWNEFDSHPGWAIDVSQPPPGDPNHAIP